jgi:hypothetical protein
MVLSFRGRCAFGLGLLSIVACADDASTSAGGKADGGGGSASSGGEGGMGAASQGGAAQGGAPQGGEGGAGGAPALIDPLENVAEVTLALTGFQFTEGYGLAARPERLAL